MIDKEVILEVFDNIINESSFKGKLDTKCRPSIDEVAYGKLKTNEEIAKFFGLEYLPDGRLDTDNSGINKNIAFYDKRNHCMLVFYTDEGRKLRGADFNNNHINGDNNDGYIANLKDVLRAYYEAPYILKKASWLLQFEAGHGDVSVAGDCAMYGINMYNACLYGDVRETMYHEMSHALAFQSIDWRNGEKLQVGQLPKSLRSKWDNAAQKDYEFQRKNNLGHMDTSRYGETNPNEDFAEMGSAISSKLSRTNYNLNSSYRVYEADETRPSGRRAHRMTVDEIIAANPNRAKLMTRIMKDTKSIDTNNKRDYINNVYNEIANMFGEEVRESW